MPQEDKRTNILLDRNLKLVRCSVVGILSFAYYSSETIGGPVQSRKVTRFGFGS